MRLILCAAALVSLSGLSIAQQADSGEKPPPAAEKSTSSRTAAQRHRERQ